MKKIPTNVIAALMIIPLTLDTLSEIFVEKAYKSLQWSALSLTGELHVPDVFFPGQMATEFDNNHYNLTSNSAWASLIPSNNGVIKVKETEFRVALYQQLQCVNHMRISILHLYEVKTVEPEILPDFKQTELCFGILRQVLLCTGDTTLESPGPSKRLANGEIEPGIITGLGVDHRCRNWERAQGAIIMM